MNAKTSLSGVSGSSSLILLLFINSDPRACLGDWVEVGRVGGGTGVIENSWVALYSVMDVSTYLRGAALLLLLVLLNLLKRGLRNWGWGALGDLGLNTYSACQSSRNKFQICKKKKKKDICLPGWFLGEKFDVGGAVGIKGTGGKGGGTRGGKVSRSLFSLGSFVIYAFSTNNLFKLFSMRLVVYIFSLALGYINAW